MKPRLIAIVVAFARIAGSVMALAGAYVLAGMLLAMIPRNHDWRPAASGGVTIWVEDNGVHTSLILPKVAAGIDWRADFPANDLRDPRFGRFDHVAIGWGERAFYLDTPTWADVRLSTLLRAAFGSNHTLLHVEHIPAPATSGTSRSITLSRDEYRRLASTIRASRQTGKALPGYGRYDAFYPAAGRYDVMHTCNDWTSDTLASAGVRVGWWTPFSSGVMRWFTSPPA